MFSVHGRTVMVRCMQRCPVANCSIVKHQWWWRLSHQQLCTATGEHPFGVSVRIADVVLTAYRTNVAGLQPGSMVPCRSVSDRRSLPAWTVHALVLSASGNWWSMSEMWSEHRKPAMDHTAVLSTDRSRRYRLLGKVSLPVQHCRSPIGTEWAWRQASGRQTSAPNVKYCAADEKWRSSWQRLSECGIACCGRCQSKFRDQGLTSMGWRSRTQF